jgi:hypothetical protein
MGESEVWLEVVAEVLAQVSAARVVQATAGAALHSRGAPLPRHTFGMPAPRRVLYLDGALSQHIGRVGFGSFRLDLPSFVMVFTLALFAARSSRELGER